MDPELAGTTAPDVTTDPSPVTETPESQVTDDTEQSAQPETETESGTVETSETTEEAKGPEPTEAEKRIRQLVARQHEAERVAAYWRGVAEGKTPNPNQEQPKVGPNGEELPPVQPQINDFAEYAEYEAAREQYLIDRAKYEYRQEDRIRTQTQEQEKLRQSFHEKVDKLAATNPEIVAILTDATLPINDAEAHIIRQSDVGPEIALYLSDHRDEANRLYGMHPILAARELGRIEAQILGARKQEPTPTKKISQAPDPVTTVNTRGAPAVDLDTVPMDEFVKRRNKEQFGKGR